MKMPKIIDYYSITLKDASLMDENVNKMILNGWQPLGTPLIVRNKFLIQVMVKYATEE